MKEYCEKHKLLSQPRRTLISSFRGDKILLATPLLRWYMDHGLKVTNVYQVIEYRPKSCFQDFANKVTAARRQGDLNPDSSVLADTFKLLGNSAYGKTIENLGKHYRVYYVENSSKLINDPLFRKQTTVADNIEEIEMAQKRIRWNLPLQIGYFVYQYAKLRMLQFYYDCLLNYIKKEDFQLCEMDTDSLYFAISGSSLESVLKNEKKEEFYTFFHTWFPSPACDIHREDFISTKCRGTSGSLADRVALGA